MEESLQETTPLLRPGDVDKVEVYPIIHMIRSDVVHFIDTPLTYEALTAPDLTYTLIRPLQEKYGNIQRNGNQAVVFCLLVNRVHFWRDQGVSTRPLSRCRAEVCDILAIRILREYGNSMRNLTLALTTSWPVYSGADPEVMRQAREDRDDLEDRVGNAIEMAIMSKGRRFIKSAPCQKVIQGIWTGKCVYQAQSSHAILSDTYKRTPFHFYDPHKAPLLDHYRLKVPAIRSVLEYSNFLILFVLFVGAIETNELNRINVPETIFMVYALGFSLEKIAAMQEHGIKVYFKGTWNGFDLALISTYGVYAVLRIYGVYRDNEFARHLGADCLALIACMMFPRLAFVTLQNNLMVLSLRAMITQFVILMLIAAFCFGGFLYALWTLSRNEAGFSIGTISWWMLDLWFGLDASGFDQATRFHPVFGPILMVTYACLSNTLLLTVLVSILSHTFSTINEDAAAEAMFRKAVSTVEGVKADSLFSYQPPVNLFALCIMLPASHILSPRWFHKVNVFMIRLTSFPILLLIAWYERQSKQYGSSGFYDTVRGAAEKVYDTLPRQFKRLSIFEALAGADADIDAIFDIEDELDNAHALDTDDYGHPPSIGGLHQRRSSQKSNGHLSNRRPSNNGPSSPRSSPQRPHRESSPGGPSSPPRLRMNSLLNRGAEAAQAFTSPLAQIFQPLVVDDDIPEEQDPHSSLSVPSISYGPASRRKHSVMQRSPAADSGVHMAQRFPTMDSQAPLSASPEAASSQAEPATAEEITEGQTHETESSEWTQRLEKLEQGQKRIEELLIKLTNSK